MVFGIVLEVEQGLQNVVLIIFCSFSSSSCNAENESGGFL